MEINSYAAQKAKSSLTPYKYNAEKLGAFDIELNITHCGICHSDIHLIDNDWHMSLYPLVPGHEVIGTVKAKGEDVTHLKVGDRVGIGWQRSSCYECEHCIRGDENMCSHNEATCVGHHGGFAEKMIADSRFAFLIPDELSSENAAPLLCGGVTVFSPLRSYNVTPQMKVGIIGIGGLGHLAVQFAKAFGCEVTVFSSSPDKEKEARRFGAHHFINSTDKKALIAQADTLDFILSTVTVDLDWSAYMQVLRPKGKLCFVGASPNPVSVPVFSLIGGQKSVCGSNIGSRPMIMDMLAFAARHKIQAQTEVMPLSKVNEALEKVRANKARYRMVLKMP